MMNTLTPFYFFAVFMLLFLAGMFILVQIANRTQREKEMAAAGRGR